MAALLIVFANYYFYKLIVEIISVLGMFLKFNLMVLYIVNG